MHNLKIFFFIFSFFLIFLYLHNVSRNIVYFNINQTENILSDFGFSYIPILSENYLYLSEYVFTFIICSNIIIIFIHPDFTKILSSAFIILSILYFFRSISFLSTQLPSPGNNYI